MSDCIMWDGYIDKCGYGRIFTPSKPPQTAHRVVYEEAKGEIPVGMEIDHLCRVRACVNVDHLEVVTHAENQARRRAAKTHCVNGHLYDEANTYWRPDGQRVCRTCANASAKRWRDRRAAA